MGDKSRIYSIYTIRHIYTREEFMKEVMSGKYKFDCPFEFKLKAFDEVKEEECDTGDTCKRCWENALKDVEFVRKEE